MKLSNVGSSRGAPMGRPDVHRSSHVLPIKLIVHHCPFEDGDYDEGGAYWGAGEPLWRAVEPDGAVEFFFRAKDRHEALEYVRGEYPNVEIVDTPRERWFEEFVMGYEECALWSTGGFDPHLPEGKQDVESLENYVLADETHAEMRLDCESFCDDAEVQLLAVMKVEGYDAGRAGHDFWLTRNGHGAGFWDRGLGELGQQLTEIAKDCGSADLYIGDDGEVYQQ